MALLSAGSARQRGERTPKCSGVIWRRRGIGRIFLGGRMGSATNSLLFCPLQCLCALGLRHSCCHHCIILAEECIQVDR
jgi:hypothetical protein